MGKISRRYITIIVLLSLTCIFVNYLEFERAETSDESIQAIKNIPNRVGLWTGKDIPLEENIYKILQTRAIIHRQYISDQLQEVFLSIVYYSSLKVDFHAPEQCFGSQGIAMGSSYKQIHINVAGKTIGLTVNQMLPKKDEIQNVVYYFYKTGKTIGPSYIKLRFNLILNKFSNTQPNGALIRISTPVLEGNWTRSEETLEEFIGLIYPFIEEYL